MGVFRFTFKGFVAAALVAAAVSIAGGVARAQATPPGFRGEFLHQFDESMAKAVMLAEAVPAETYPRRPLPAVTPMAEMFAHIARFNYEYPARAMGIAPPAGTDLDALERVAEKAQVVALLRRSADHVRQKVRRMPDAQFERMTTLYGRKVPQWAVLFHLIAHMDNHLGQAIAYGRVSGVAPRS